MMKTDPIMVVYKSGDGDDVVSAVKVEDEPIKTNHLINNDIRDIFVFI